MLSNGNLRRALALIGVVTLLAGALAPTAAATPGGADDLSPGQTATPIKHLVVIFQENVSFDHYFATYPFAANPAGEPRFVASKDTPSVNGLSSSLLEHNPNSANPFRLDRSQAITCDQDHSYADEQKAYDGGLLDRFVQSVGNSTTGCDPEQVMGYYDGNTVTAIWKYAQAFAMSDNSFGTNFGPSAVGALDLVAGQTHGATPTDVKNATANGTVIGDPRPGYDDCSTGTTVAMSGKNVGDLLNVKGVTWGWFQGGFRPTGTSGGKAVCGSSHTNVGGASVKDYIPHHEPFQFYLQTANPHHMPPTSTAMIGRTDQANHQYDLADFWAAVDAHNMPAVSYLKAAAYQDGHAGYSDPLDEQRFLVDTINRLEKTPEWSSTAVVIAYDDSDGWYDHVMPPLVSPSSDPTYDALFGAGLCGTAPAGTYEDRCGYGPRLPLLVISPYAKRDFVDHSVTDQSSILRFVEDNWRLGRLGNQSLDARAGTLTHLFDFANHARAPRLFLDPSTGLRTQGSD